MSLVINSYNINYSLYDNNQDNTLILLGITKMI